MPIYEYECLDCGRRFEKLLLKLDAQISCPDCGGRNAAKRPSLFSSPGGKKAADFASSGSGSCAGCTSRNCGSCG